MLYEHTRKENVIDPLAEISRKYSPFVYGNNNALRFIDPDGMAVTEVEGGLRYEDQDAIDKFAELQREEESGQDDSGNPKKKSKTGAKVAGLIGKNENDKDVNTGGGYLDKAWDWAKEHFEVSGGYELSYGFQIGGGFKEGVAAFVNAKAIVHSDLSFSNKAPISANKYRPREKTTHGIGGAYYLGVDYKRETVNGQSLNTVSAGIVGFGGNVTWGQNGVTNWFFGFDPSFKAALGVGLEGKFRIGFSK